jgi:hypothetical protein
VSLLSQAVKNLVADGKQHLGQPEKDPITEFGSASVSHEDKGHDTLMSSCWSLLSDILSVARTQGLAPDEKNKEKYMEALLQVRELTKRSDNSRLQRCCCLCP